MTTVTKNNPTHVLPYGVEKLYKVIRLDSSVEHLPNNDEFFSIKSLQRILTVASSMMT